MAISDDAQRAIRVRVQVSWESELLQWAISYYKRDMIVTEAWKNGVTKYRISQITGLTRPTIDRILKPHEKPGKGNSDDQR